MLKVEIHGWRISLLWWRRTDFSSTPSSGGEFQWLHWTNQSMVEGKSFEMNAKKTQAIWFGIRQQLVEVHIDEIQLLLNSAPSQYLYCHVSRSCSWYKFINNAWCNLLQIQLRAARRSLSGEITKILVHSFVSGRLIIVIAFRLK